MADEQHQFTVCFIVDASWTENGLLIECPTVAARDFMARALEEPIVLRVKGEKCNQKGDKDHG